MLLDWPLFTHFLSLILNIVAIHHHKTAGITLHHQYCAPDSGWLLTDQGRVDHLVESTTMLAIWCTNTDKVNRRN